MTAPAPEVVSPEPGEPTGPIPDDLLAEALTARAERNGRLELDTPSTPDAPATPEPVGDPAGDAAPKDSTASEAPATPAPGADAPPEAPADPFADALKAGTPFTYTVDRQAKTFDGLVDLGDKGAFVRPDAVARLKDTIQRAEHATEQNRTLYAQVREFESLGGVAKLTETVERNAQLNASALHILTAVFENPRQFVNDDGSPNQTALDLLRREAKAAAQEAQWQVRSERQTQADTAQASQRDAEVRQTAIPSYLGQAHAGLHPEDRALIEAQAAHYLFTTTPENAAAYGQPVGTLMIDTDALGKMATHLTALRAAGKVEADKRAAAAAENAKRTATPPAPRKPVAPQQTRNQQPRNKDGTFAEPTARVRRSPAKIFEDALAQRPIGANALSD